MKFQINVPQKYTFLSGMFGIKIIDEMPALRKCNKNFA